MPDYCAEVGQLLRSSFFTYFYYIYGMKAIYLTELAQQYFPNSTPRSAVAQLRRWVSFNSDLRKRLEELHYTKRQRALTPLQHGAFIEYLGEPGA